MKLAVSFTIGKETKNVYYEKQDIMDLDLAYAITIHKSQGSEFDVVIIPWTLRDEVINLCPKFGIAYYEIIM